MNIREEQEIKKEFQLERVILFSDAVFAIIITIMVIDIKLPETVRNADVGHIREAFIDLYPKLVAYGISFFLVAAFWMRHLKIFSFLKDYNNRLLGLNLLFLFSVSLFPFAVSLVSSFSHLKTLMNSWGINIYISIILLTAFSQAILTVYLHSNRERLCIRSSTLEEVLQIKVQKAGLVVIPVLGLIVFTLNYFNINATYSLWTAALLGIINSRLRSKYYPKKKKPGMLHHS